MQAIWQCSTGILRNIRQPCKNMIGSQYPHAGPHCIAGRRWLQGSLGATEDVIAWRMRDSSNPPVTCLNPQEGDHACPAWCWFEPMDQLDNIKMDPAKCHRRSHWHQGLETDSRTFYKWSGIGSLVTVSQSVLTPCVTGCWPSPPLLSRPTPLLSYLPKQLGRRKSLCNVNPILLSSFLMTSSEDNSFPK